ncbi:MAG: hypothetical protein VKQ33_15650 [Candidatus Sericytochromatia bacterium]|nr:hypothetical protein [Candidatus Sericytochromatia bacterium]
MSGAWLERCARRCRGAWRTWPRRCKPVGREAQARMWAAHHGGEATDPISTDYALASLFVLSVRTAERPLFGQALQRFTARRGPHAGLAGRDPYPLGVMEAVQAWWQRLEGRQGASLRHLEAAAEAFGPGAGLEQLWLRVLRAHLTGEACATADVARLRARQAPAFPVQPRMAAVDEAHAGLALSGDDVPFPWLSAPTADGVWAGVWQGFV